MTAHRHWPPYLDLPPLAAARGHVRLPGSKSLSNRMLLLAALAHGDTQVHDLLDSDDTRHMLAALKLLGVAIEGEAGADRVLAIRGCGGDFPSRHADLFLGNAGTAVRPLTAALAIVGGDFRLSGVPRMHERPIGDLVDALHALGATVAYLGERGFPPLAIGRGSIDVSHPVRVRGDVSSQFLTALLMALPLVGRRAVIEVEGELISKPYIEITLALMARFGVVVERDGFACFTIPEASRYTSPGVLHVEGDASGASYFLAAGAIGGGPVRVEGVGRDSVQGDVRFADALEAMGARVTRADGWIEAAAPADGRLRAFDLDLNTIPDAAMTLAVAALFADGPCALRNIASWRVKETDRLAAMAAELRKVGAVIDERADSLIVTPPPAGQLRGAVIRTWDDHRMAMCLSLATLGGVPLRIDDPGCVAKTFPDYFERLAAVGVVETVPVIAIDGPAASGKGTVAEGVARALGFGTLDSGSLYRLAALAGLRLGVDLDHDAAMGAVAADLDVRFEPGGRIRLAGDDVTDAIRDEAVSQAASRVAVHRSLRDALLWRQRAFRVRPGLVAEGRDMGTVVFPDATLKVFLTASAAARAERRHKQLMQKGTSVSLAALLHEIEARDARDSSRVSAPLVAAADALLLDTTALDADAAVGRIVEWAVPKLEAAGRVDR
jgi:3-phosphoshikimate 1-carboxyvinyltransferase